MTLKPALLWRRVGPLLVLVAALCWPRSADAQRSSAAIHQEMGQKVVALRTLQGSLRKAEQRVYLARKAVSAAKVEGQTGPELKTSSEAAKRARLEVRRLRRQVRESERQFDRSFQSLQEEAGRVARSAASALPVPPLVVTNGQQPPEGVLTDATSNMPSGDEPSGDMPGEDAGPADLPAAGVLSLPVCVAKLNQLLTLQQEEARKRRVQEAKIHTLTLP